MRIRNVRKKRMPCLRCGRMIYTDICHRFCKKCQRANREAYAPTSYRVTSP
jgi:hypothetical protein